MHDRLRNMVLMNNAGAAKLDQSGDRRRACGDDRAGLFRQKTWSSATSAVNNPRRRASVMQVKASIDLPQPEGPLNSSPVLPTTIAVAWMLKPASVMLRCRLAKRG